ncbi:MAG TPA: type II toxin-antitoxin system RelE/ParE family toxin [Caulobacteraceae bacterium]
MNWRVQFHADFAREADALSETVRVELIARIRLLEHLGSSLGRPAVDTLSGSKHANMKELRFRADGGVWRIAFAFDPERAAILLVGGDKSGVSSGRFYKGLIKRADARFDQHLEALK